MNKMSLWRQSNLHRMTVLMSRSALAPLVVFMPFFSVVKTWNVFFNAWMWTWNFFAWIHEFRFVRKRETRIHSFRLRNSIPEYPLNVYGERIIIIKITKIVSDGPNHYAKILCKNKIRYAPMAFLKLLVWKVFLYRLTMVDDIPSHFLTMLFTLRQLLV